MSFISPICDQTCHYLMVVLSLLERFEATQGTVAHSDKVDDCEIFFVYKRPHFSKLEIFIKVSVISVLLFGVMASAIVRVYR